MFRQILHKLLGMRFVVLELHDGDNYIRRAYKVGDYWYAHPYSPRTRCKLLPDGKVKGQSYVVSWHPYLPNIPYENIPDIAL